jgi:hypothetical protein
VTTSAGPLSWSASCVHNAVFNWPVPPFTAHFVFDVTQPLTFN